MFSIFNYFYKSKNTLPESTIAWDFEANIQILQTLLKMTRRREHVDYLNYSKDLMERLQLILKHQGTPSHLMLVMNSQQKPLGVVLECGGAFWSPMGIEGIQKTLNFHKLSLSTLVELKPIENQAKEEAIEEDLQITARTLIEPENIKYVEIKPSTPHIKYEAAIQKYYAVTSDFLKNEPKKEVQFIDNQEHLNTSLSITSLSSIPLISTDKFIEALKQNGQQFQSYPNLEKIQKQIVKQDKKTIMELRNGAPTHSFLSKFNDFKKKEALIIEINLDNQNKQTKWLSLLGRALDMNVAYQFKQHVRDKSKEPVIYYDALLTNNEFLNLNTSNQPLNFILNQHTWEKKLKQSWGNSSINYYKIKPRLMVKKTRLCSMNENPHFFEIVKMEREHIIKSQLKTQPNLLKKRF